MMRVRACYLDSFELNGDRRPEIGLPYFTGPWELGMLSHCFSGFKWPTMTARSVGMHSTSAM